MADDRCKHIWEPNGLCRLCNINIAQAGIGDDLEALEMVAEIIDRSWRKLEPGQFGAALSTVRFLIDEEETKLRNRVSTMRRAHG